MQIDVTWQTAGMMFGWLASIAVVTWRFHQASSAWVDRFHSIERVLYGDAKNKTPGLIDRMGALDTALVSALDRHQSDWGKLSNNVGKLNGRLQLVETTIGHISDPGEQRIATPLHAIEVRHVVEAADRERDRQRAEGPHENPTRPSMPRVLPRPPTPPQPVQIIDHRPQRQGVMTIPYRDGRPPIPRTDSEFPGVPMSTDPPPPETDEPRPQERGRRR